MKPDQPPSTRPYLIRALHEWCCDNGYTPYMAVAVDATVRVPIEFVQDGQIVLNTSYEAASQLQLGNETIEFKARFGGVVRAIQVPVDHVVAIYARENLQGMAFEPPTLVSDDQVLNARPDFTVVEGSASAPLDEEPVPPPPTPSSPPGPSARPTLRRVK